MQMKYYAVRMIDGIGCDRVFRGFAPIREMIDAGHTLRFSSAASEDIARELTAARDEHERFRAESLLRMRKLKPDARSV